MESQNIPENAQLNKKAVKYLLATFWKTIKMKTNKNKLF